MLKRKQKLKIASSGAFSGNASLIVVRVLESLSELSKILDHRRLLTEAAMEMFLENSCMFYERQIILLNIDLLRSS